MNQKKHQPVMCASICLEFMMSDLFSPYCNYYEVLHEERELQTSQEILEEYKHADRKRHCDMWFMFHGLREKFDDIGRSQLKKSDSEALRWFRLL